MFFINIVTECIIMTKKKTGIQTETIPLSDVGFETALKVREGFDEETIDRYAEKWKDYMADLQEYENSSADGAVVKKPVCPFPLCKVARTDSGDDGKRFEAVSGGHRIQGAMEAGMTEMKVEIVEGTPEELLELAIVENRHHGRPNSSADLKRCILSLHEVFPGYTYREIAEVVGCGKSYVGLVLGEQKQSDRKTKQNSVTSKTQKDDSVQHEEEKESEESYSWSEFVPFVLKKAKMIKSPDDETAGAMENLAVGIVGHLAKTRPIKPLQDRIGKIKSK